MPKYLKTNATAKSGINYIRTIVESHNCIFQKIDQENDVGIDALIEVVLNENPTGKFVAAQIKSGASYFDKKASICKIPVEKHRNYWLKHALPVYGIVYIPEYESAYWVDIKKYLDKNPDGKTISFQPNLTNIINGNTFITQFVPHLMGEVPEISFDLAVELFHSENADELYLGLYTLFKKYAARNEVWKMFVEYFRTKPAAEIPGRLVYYLSVIPWHPDIWYFKDSYTDQSRAYGQTLLNEFEKEDIRKLLEFVDEETMISRGTLGQSVEAIVSSIPNCKSYLEQIILDSKEEMHIREVAVAIYAINFGKNSINVLSSIIDDSWYASQIVEYIKQYGEFNPYV